MGSWLFFIDALFWYSGKLTNSKLIDPTQVRNSSPGQDTSTYVGFSVESSDEVSSDV